MEARTRAVTKTLWICLAANITVCVLKLAVGYSTKTLAFLADGIHSLFDGLASGIGIFSVLQSAKPPDEGHPYGHKKFEILAAVGLALLLAIAAVEVGTMAWDKVFRPAPPISVTLWAFGVLVLNFAVNWGISRYEALQAERYQSRILLADAMHTQSDAWVTLAVLCSLAANFLSVPYIDAILTLGIAAYLGLLSVRLILSNFDPLVDKRVLDAREVSAIVRLVPGVVDCHHVRSRGEKNYHFLDLNIHMDGQLSLEKAHEIAHAVEHRLREAFPGLADVVIHAEPHGHLPCKDEGEY